jgi:S-adenosylmethionine:tRNA ribosyltransferase-isomerase
MLVYDRDTKKISHARFYDLIDFLDKEDLLVINQTRVILARLFGRKVPSGGRAELLLLRRDGDRCWRAMVGGKGLKPGVIIKLDDGPDAVIKEDLGGPIRLIEFSEPIQSYLDAIGHVPLPPYIHEVLTNPELYQTVYAQELGSAAAPTAGLHFTPKLMDKIQQSGIRFAEVTLHIGLDTFAPVHEADPRKHLIHKEWCQISENTAKLVNKTKQNGGRIIAVGTTTVRTLETAALKTDQDQFIVPFSGETDLFILPGYEFQIVDCMITNFHLPESTLIMMVSAFAGREIILDLYQTAMELGYRFYSFGDAMLIT